ncbi:unnamed protein product [Ectocarpus sp. CCAP 1310/34]|nr:unnamed protein product [Ectocarpus sp. CCAP 1310/34]
MSGATMARANFKKYTDITNPLAAGQSDTPDGSSSTDAWRDSENLKSGRQKEEGEEGKEDEEEEEEEDPFGLGSIMSKAEKEEEEDEGQEGEEEDPFGLGAIMDEPNKGAGTSTSKRSGSGADEPRQKKAHKTTADGTTGGYFKGTTSLTSAQSSVAEASRQPFRAADSFSGARKGYVFQKGPLGLGYYADKVQIRATAAADAVVAVSRAKSRGPEARGSGGRPATEGREKKKQAVDVAASLQKLKVFILKPKKAAKAASLMADLMEAHMRPDNARMFFRALKPLAEEPAGEAALAAGEGGARAFRKLAERASEWVAAPSEGVRAVTWELLFGLRHDTKTDDSFTFARAIKRLREAIEALGDVTGGGKATNGTAGEGDDGEGTGSARGNGASLSLERKVALMLVMKEAFKSYHLAWARSSIEPAFKAAADRRLLFPEGELRDTLDGFTDAITKRQRNPGGLMAPPSRSVRAHNSTAHPMLNKRSDVIR